MKTRVWPMLLALLSAPCSAQSSDDLDKLIVAGELDRAETLARAGGDSLRVVLADILVMIGFGFLFFVVSFRVTRRSLD